MPAVLKKRQSKELKGIPNINLESCNLTEYPISPVSIKYNRKILFYVQKYKLRYHFATVQNWYQIPLQSLHVLFIKKMEGQEYKSKQGKLAQTGYPNSQTSSVGEALPTHLAFT